MSGRILLASTIALRGATLIDGTGAPPVPDSLLVVSNGRILSVGTATTETLDALPADVPVVSLEGKWIVPGFIDAHVHAESDEDLKQMLRWGVTGVRLMAEDVAAARALARRAMRPGSGMPDVFASAPIFTRRHGWWAEGHPADANVDRFPATPEEARAAVRKAAALGAQEIKLMLDDMAWCRSPRPVLPKVEPEVVRALVETARRLGLRVTVHAPQLVDAELAVTARATALAHGVLDPLREETVAKMKKRPVYYIPTMDIFEFLADPRAFVDGVLSDPAAAAGLSPETLARLRSKKYADGYRERYPNSENVKRHLPALRENLRRLHGAGVPIALGTDMWAFPGLGVSIEMDLYVKAGLSPLEAIQAATQTSARSLAIEANRGTLEPGKQADFLVLLADPLQDVRNTRKISDIYKNGERVGPGAGLRAASDGR